MEGRGKRGHDVMVSSAATTLFRYHRTTSRLLREGKLGGPCCSAWMAHLFNDGSCHDRKLGKGDALLLGTFGVLGLRGLASTFLSFFVANGDDNGKADGLTLGQTVNLCVLDPQVLCREPNTTRLGNLGLFVSHLRKVPESERRSIYRSMARSSSIMGLRRCSVTPQAVTVSRPCRLRRF